VDEGLEVYSRLGAAEPKKATLLCPNNLIPRITHFIRIAMDGDVTVTNEAALLAMMHTGMYYFNSTILGGKLPYPSRAAAEALRRLNLQPTRATAADVAALLYDEQLSAEELAEATEIAKRAQKVTAWHKRAAAVTEQIHHIAGLFASSAVSDDDGEAAGSSAPLLLLGRPRVASAGMRARARPHTLALASFAACA
jgi:hypothetical protein